MSVALANLLYLCCFLGLAWEGVLYFLNGRKSIPFGIPGPHFACGYF